tara:strand:+ start:4082 stop:5680 length:1599 start_codon:yes stop_codon:yes gene_type:complete
MSKAEARTEVNQLSQTQKNAEYIEKKINSLSFYSAYWCLFELRSLHRLPDRQILRDDTRIKLKLIRILKNANYSPKGLDEILQTSADESVPLSYVRWFYEDDRAALWINMVLKKYNVASGYIQTKSDIAIFAHNFIFNTNVQVLAKSIHIGSDSYNDSLVLNKKQVLGFLEQAYVRSKVGLGKTKWLDSRNDIQVNHLYQYMQKPCDLNNIYVNKINKKANTLIKLDTVMPSPGQALICADTIVIKESDRVSRLNHMLASLDYWMFDTYWFDREGVAVEGGKANNRITFIEMMKNVSNSKANRVSNKNIKEKGLVLTSANKKTLKLIAKKQGKTQAQMLNDIVASYNQTFFSEVPKTTRATGTYITGDYGKPYTDTFETQQSLKAKQASSETILVDSDSEETKDINHQIESLGSVPNIKDSDEDKSEEHVENFVEKEYNDQYKNPEDINNNNTDNSIDEPIFNIIPPKDVIIHVHTPTSETDVSTMKSQVAESNLASAENLHRIDQIVADEDPFSKNARIANQKMGKNKQIS